MGFLDYLDNVEKRLDENNLIEEPKKEKKKVIRKVNKKKSKPKKAEKKISETLNHKSVIHNHASLILDGIEDTENDVVIENNEAEDASVEIKIPENGNLSKMSTKNHASLLL